MKRLNKKRVARSLLLAITVIGVWLIGIFIIHNFLVTPVINFLSANDSARVFIACIVSWLALSTLFSLLFERGRK